VQPDPSSETLVLRWGNVALGSVCAGYIAYVYATSGGAGLAEVVTTAGLSVAVFGKLVIFWGLREGAPPIASLAFMTFLIDLVFASALASGLRGLEKAPLLGGWLRNGRARAKEVLKEYPGLKRLAFFGVVAFVLLPFAGTGAITGSIVARLLGLSRLAGIGAVALASAWAATSFALLAVFMGEKGKEMLENPLLLAGVVGIAAVVGWVLYQRFVQELRRKS
jgi:uncharacterized membrane protein